MRPALPGDLQCGEAVEGGKGIIRENQVEAALLERRDEISLGFNARYLAGNAVGLERFLNQLRVPGVIFQRTESAREFHFRASHFLMLPGGGSLITAQKTPSSLMAFTNSWKSTGFTT